MQQLSAFMELFKAGAAPGSRREGQCWGWPRVLPRGGQVSPKGPSGLSRSYHAMVPALMRRVSPKWSGFRGRVGAAATCPRGVSSPADLPHLGARACDFPYSDLQKPHPVSDHLLGQAIRGNDKQTHCIHTNGNGDKKSH